MRRADLVAAAGALAGLLTSLYINYHSYLADFNLVPGDRGDTRLLIFTLEHWYSLLRGHESFLSLNMFYPDRMALAYSDGLFLLGIPYSVFRWAGSDPFTSYQLVLALLTVVGYLAWLMLMRKAVGLRPGFAVLAAVLLSSMNSIQFQADNGQLRSVLLYPLLALLLWGFAGAAERRSWRATLCLMGFGGGLALLFFTSYYAAWFFLFALTMLGFLALLAECIFESPTAALSHATGFVRACRWQLIAGLAAFAISLTPFVMTYAPLIEASSSRSFSLVLQFAPTPADLINVSPGNYVWSPVLRALHFGFGNREVQTGSPVLVMVLFGISLVGLASRLRRTGWRRASRMDRWMLLLAFTGGLLAVLSMRVQDFSLWFLIYRFVPGASALRALGRILVIVDMISIVGALYGMEKAVRASSTRPIRRTAWLTAGTVLLGIMLIMEEVNDVQFRLDKAGQLAAMSRYQEPQAECRAFFLDNTASDDLPVGYYQLDAMMISMRLGVPSVNGYSGVQPDEAFGMVPGGDEYNYRILDWLLSQGATHGICRLDAQTAAFRPTNVPAEHARFRAQYQAELAEAFSEIHRAAMQFLKDDHPLSELYPQRLEELGYLDRKYGYATGAQYHWVQNRYWIGARPCNKQAGCFGIGVEGSYVEVQKVLDAFGDEALRVLFPSPTEWQADRSIPQETAGELMMIFSAPK